MYKGFLKGLIVGILEIVLIVLVKLLVDYLSLDYTILYVVMAVSLVAYIIFLIYLIEKYVKYVEEKKKLEEKEEKPAVKIEIKPKVIEEKRVEPVIKPRVIEKIVEIPSGDLSFVELKDYIKYNLYYGRDVKRIRQNLLDVGWTKEEIDKAFDEVGEVKPIANVDAETVEKEVERRLKKEISRLRGEVEGLRRRPAKVIREVKPVVVAVKEKPSKRYTHRFVASRDGGKYHTYNCHWGDAIEDKKQRFFKTKAQAQRAGYSACKGCVKRK